MLRNVSTELEYLFHYKIMRRGGRVSVARVAYHARVSVTNLRLRARARRRTYWRAGPLKKIKNKTDFEPKFKNNGG